MTGHIEQSPSTSPPSDGNVSTVPETSEANVHILQTSDNTSSNQLHLLQHLQILNGSRVNPNSLPDSDYTLLVPMPPAAIPVQVSSLNGSHTDESSDCDQTSNEGSLGHVKNTKLDGFDGFDQETTLDMDTHMTQHGKSRSKFLVENADGISTSRLSATSVTIKEEPTSEGEQQVLSGDDTNDSSNGHMMEMTTVLCKTSFNSQSIANNPKTWTQQDMENALEALRSHNMSLTKASATYGIPSTTLWQRAHRLGIDTPKKEGPSKSWSETNLHNALQALRTGSISANKASKAYGIPSSTLYKIARREGIRLAAPFNAAPTTWRPNDLERALDSIRSGHSSVQRASTEFGIPTGTLYGRCKREGIELSRSNPTPWSEDAMGEALEAVRVGQMSINQAAIHYNLPYSSLYGRFKRCKFEVEVPLMESQPTVQPVHHQMSSVVQHHHMPAQQTQIIQQMQHQVPHHGQSMIAHNPADANIPHAHHADMSSTHVYSVYHHPITSPASQPSTTHRPDNGMLGPGRDCIPTS